MYMLMLPVVELLPSNKPKNLQNVVDNWLCFRMSFLPKFLIITTIRSSSVNANSFFFFFFCAGHVWQF